MVFLNVFWLWIQIIAVDMMKHEKSVDQVRWSEKCTKDPVVLNDCNWCRCGNKAEYVCHARVCSQVDLFGHFNDAIREFDPGMGVHGSWRTTQTACEPNVRYRRSDLLCICNDDGTWPNPVCRDIFQVLHSVEVTDISTVNKQECEHNKRCLVGCNVCFCSKEGLLDPKLCTNNKCKDDDPVLQANEQLSEEDQEAVEIYAECRPEKKYKLGCKNCVCLRNNRLLCNNCTNESPNDLPSLCDHVKPGQVFSKDCNFCYCDNNGYIICTTKKCVTSNKRKFSIRSFNNYEESEESFDHENCAPGHTYRQGCNLCFCALYFGRKIFGCTLKYCERIYSPTEAMQVDCVNGTKYELNCLVCHCQYVDGMKTQVCQVNPKCQGDEALERSSTNDLDSLHGYCEPLHTYKRNCNTCKCLTDGKTVKCTSYVCEYKPEPISAEMVPILQRGRPCPKGLSYKIDCNYCFCLSNGNAICTTAKCEND